MNKVTLSDIAKFTGGSGFPEKYQGEVSGDYLFIKVSDMNLPSNKRYIVEANNYVSSEVANRLNFHVFEKNTTVFAKVGAAIFLNRCRKLVKDTIIDNNMMGATPKTVDSDYLFYVLSSIDFGRLVQMGALPSINQTLFDRLECVDFPLPQQQKIARILSTVDAVIEKTEAAIAKYKAIKAGMMHDLFTRGIDDNGQLRPTYEDSPDLHTKSLKEMAVISYGKDYKSNPEGGNIPIYGTGGIMGFTSKALNNGAAVLTGRKGSINKPVYIEGDFWNVDTIFCVKPIDSSINLKWIYYNLLNTDLNKLNEATGVPSVNSNALYRLKFNYCPFPEQQKIVNALSSVDVKIHAEQITLNKYQKIKQGLMQDLLTGKVKVSIDSTH